MKQHYFLIILFSTLFANAQIVAIPDANFKAKLLLSSPTNQIAQDLSGNYVKIDANSDGQIQVSEAVQVSYLDVNYSEIASLQGITSFTQLRFLNCSANSLTQLNVTPLTLLNHLECGSNNISTLTVYAPAVTYLYCRYNDLSSFDFNSLPNLMTLDCSENSLGILDVSGLTNLQTLICEGDELTNLDISTLPQLTQLECSFNSLSSIDFPTLSQLTYLDCNYNQFTSLNVSALTQLQAFNCSNNQITNLNVTNLSNLLALNCSTNELSALNLSGLTSIHKLDISNNQFTSINVANLTTLTDLECYNNVLTSLNILPLVNLTSLFCDNNQLSSLNVLPLTNLVYFSCTNNQLTALNVSSLINLNYFYCGYNQLTALDTSPLDALLDLSCTNNQIVSSTLLLSTHLEGLDCSNNLLGTLNVTGLTQLRYLTCDNNLLTDLNTTGLSSLLGVSCDFNQLTALDVSSLTGLQSLSCSDNQLTALNIGTLPTLDILYCRNNQLAELDCSHLPHLESIYCDFNQLTTLDFSSSATLYNCLINNNPMVSLFIKNGSVDEFVSLFGLDSLQYICADEGQIESVQSYIDDASLPNCHVNSYCNFTPGGPFYTIQGSTKYDENTNGCDAADNPYPGLKLTFTNNTNSGSLIADTSGLYRYDVQEGTHTFIPVLENPTYFTISPATSTVTFPAQASPFIQDFCVEPNGIHNDLEIALIPLDVARPGFDVPYKIIYKNKGTHTQSGSINLSYDEALFDYVSSNPATGSQSAGNLNWTFSSLLPFETREMEFILNLNSPLETPAVQSGAILSLTAIVSGNLDESPVDNTASLNQTAVNSFDPNNKTCLEGTKLLPSMIGNYVHYMIRFENLGTYAAQNIVVKDIIDTAKFDITSLIPLEGSAPFVTRITNTNQVEFIFENINLPFNDALNDGYVIFKIKTKPTLVLGDVISNTASIYFDYNPAIVTNTFNTQFVSSLSNATFTENDITLFPNPAHNAVYITLQNTSEMMENIRVYDILGKTIALVSNLSTNQITIDTSTFSKGVYIVEVTSEHNLKQIKKLIIE